MTLNNLKTSLKKYVQNFKGKTYTTNAILFLKNFNFQSRVRINLSDIDKVANIYGLSIFIFCLIYFITSLQLENFGFLKWIPYLLTPVVVFITIYLGNLYVNNKFISHFSTAVILLLMFYILYLSLLKLKIGLLYSVTYLQIAIIFSIYIYIRKNFRHLLNNDTDGYGYLGPLLYLCSICLLFYTDLTNWNVLLEHFYSKKIKFIFGSLILICALYLMLFQESNKKAPPEIYPKSYVQIFIHFFVLISFAFLSFRSDSLFTLTKSGNPIYHWSYYVGVIESIRNGGILLWDTPSQYGFLNLLIPALLPIKSAWQSFYIFQGFLLFLISSLFYFSIIKYYKLLYQRFLIFLIIVMAVFFADPDFFGPYPFPSSSVLRFFFAYVILCASILFPKPGLRQAVMLSLLCSLGIFWSAESAIYSVSIYIFIAIGVCVNSWGTKTSFRNTAAYYLALPPLFVIIGLVGLALIYRLNFDIIPDPQSFIEHGFGYASGFGYVPLNFSGPIYILLFFFISICAITSLFIKSNQAVTPILCPLLASAGCIWSISSYYFGRPVPQNITAMMPIITLCILTPVAVLTKYKKEMESCNLYLTLHKLLIFPFIFIIIIALFNSSFRLTLLNTKSLSQNIESNLPRADIRIIDLFNILKINTHTNFIYYSDDGTLPIFEHTMSYLNNPMSRWLPIPLQLMETPVTDGRRYVYISRYLCRHPMNNAVLVTKKNIGISLRLNNFISDLKPFYKNMVRFEDNEYIVLKFSDFQDKICI